MNREETMDAHGKNFGTSFASQNGDRFDANFENHLLATAKRKRGLWCCFDFYGAVSNEPFDAISLLDVIASLPILRTIRFLLPPRRERRPDALFKKLLSHGELQRSSLSLSLSLSFFIFLRVQRFSPMR